MCSVIIQMHFVIIAWVTVIPGSQSWQRKLDAAKPCITNSRTFDVWVYDQTEPQAELLYERVCGGCYQLKDASPSNEVSKSSIWEMTARRMLLKFLIVGVVFMPFLTQAEANITGTYGFSDILITLECVYWENLFTLITSWSVNRSHRMSTFNFLYILTLKQYLLNNIKHQKTNLFQNLQMYFTHHYRIRLTTLEMPKRGRQSSQFPFFKQGNAWDPKPNKHFQTDNSFESILVLFCQHVLHSKEGPRLITMHNSKQSIHLINLGAIRNCLSGDIFAYLFWMATRFISLACVLI